MDIVIVNPSDKKKVYGHLSDSLTSIEPPLWSGLLAAYLRQNGFSVKMIDADADQLGPQETVEQIIDCHPILVALGAVGANPSASSTPKMLAVRSVAACLKERKPHIKIVTFGIHPSSLPERTLEEEPVDFVCQGEVFYPMTELLTWLKKEKRQNDFSIKGIWSRKGEKVMDGGWAEVIADIDELPFVAWDLLPMQKYKAHNWHCFEDVDNRSPYAMIYTSLGCPFNCHYCNIHALYSGRPGIRYRSPEKVVAEIDYLVDKYKIKHLKILDELFVVNHKRVEAICDLLIARDYKLNIWAYARVDTVNDHILRKLKAAGVNWLAYGIEAGSKTVRAGVAKGRFDEQAIFQAMEMTKKAGIYILGNFMFGLPDDNLETMRETYDLAKEINCEYINFYTTMAYPGSALYTDTLKAGGILPVHWLGFSQFNAQTTPLATKYLSPAQVLEFRDNAFVEYFKRPEYQKMIAEKFGPQTLEHVQKNLTKRITRKLLNNEAGVTHE